MVMVIMIKMKLVGKKKKQLYKITVCILGWIRRVLNVHYILEVIGETLRTIS